MRPLWATAFAGLLLLSILAVAPGAAHASPATPSAPQISTVQIRTTTSYGSLTTSFSAGYGYGQVYFTAYDPSGDTSAQVRINDLNASRDHLSNPVANWTVHFPSGSYNNSYLWNGNGYYQIPLDLVYGGTWNITIQGTLGGFSFANFTVHTYTVYLTPTSPTWMAGHTNSVLYNINATANQAPYRNITSVVVAENYYSSTAGHLVAVPGSPKSLGATSQGQFSVDLPSDAASYIQFVIWANVSTPAVNLSVVGGLAVQIGTISPATVRLANCPTLACGTSVFTDGAPAYVFIHETLSGFFSSANGTNLSVKVQFERGSTIVNPSGSPPTSLTTNTTGGAELLFVASSQVFSTSGTNSVVVTISDPINSAATPATTTVNFFVIPPGAGVATLQVSLDNLQYFGGDTATATWVLGGINASVTGGWIVDSWQVWSSYSSTLLAQGTIASTSTQGTFQFTAPLSFAGKIRATVTAHNTSAAQSANAYAFVTAPTILLTPNEAYFLPGDTVTVNVATNGGVLSSAQMWETVTDSVGNTISSGILSGHQVTVSVPKVAAPSYYRISVAAQDPTLGVIASASVSVDQGSGYLIFAGVDTVSSYADGSFQPGQTINLHYTIAAIGGAVLPKTFYLEIYPAAGFFGSGSGTLEVSTSQPTGNVQYTIPSSMPRGAQSFYVYSYMGSCVSVCYADTQFAVNVNPSPSALSYELGAGSGITVAWLVLFLIVVLLAIVGLAMMRRNRGRGGRSESPRPFTPPTTSTPPPPASPPQTAPAAPWEEPNRAAVGGGGSSHTPPLPRTGGSS